MTSMEQKNQDNEVDQLLASQVKKGYFSSVVEAGRHTIAHLIERDIDRGIQKSREQHAKGESFELNREYIDHTIKKLAKKYLPRS